MSKPLYLLGCGDHGLVVLDALLESRTQVTGILDPNMTAGDRVFGVSVVGSDAFLDSIDASAVLLVNGVGANPKTASRVRLFATMKARSFIFHSVQHPSALVGRECTLGEGCQIMAGAVLQPRVTLGNNSLINTRAVIEHDASIGPHSVVSPGVTVCGDVTTGEGVFIGAGAVILPGIKIGVHAIVGAGAVVIDAVPDHWIVAGNPAAKIGMTTT